MAIRQILDPTQIANEVELNISAYARGAFIDEFPLATRLARVPIGSNSFEILTHAPRPRTLALGADITANNTTTITISDVSSLMLGDVLEVGDERVEVSGTITISNTTTGAGTAVVTRAVEGTTATNATASNTTHANTNTVLLIGNSRTGAEVDQDAYRVTRVVATQYVQTFQFPVQVGGRTEALSDVVVASTGMQARFPGLGSSPMMSREEEDKLRDMMRDIEGSSLYGLGENGATAATRRWKQKGLKALIDSDNVEETPTNASAYKPSDLERDTVAKIMDAGGQADLLVVSTNFAGGFSIWGQHALQLTPGETRFGVNMRTYISPFFPTLQIMVSQALRAGTAVALDSRRVRMRYIRQETYKPRGSRGDAYEADWLADMCIELEDPEQAGAWVEGITAFTVPA